jgi:hypothetical protein
MVQGGDDRTTTTKTSLPVAADHKLWKWVIKKVILDVKPLKEFYANPTNANQLFHPRIAQPTTHSMVPYLLHLPLSIDLPLGEGGRQEQNTTQANNNTSQTTNTPAHRSTKP